MTICPELSVAKSCRPMPSRETIPPATDEKRAPVHVTFHDSLIATHYDHISIPPAAAADDDVHFNILYSASVPLAYTQ